MKVVGGLAAVGGELNKVISSPFRVAISHVHRSASRYDVNSYGVCV